MVRAKRGAEAVERPFAGEQARETFVRAVWAAQDPEIARKPVEHREEWIGDRTGLPDPYDLMTMQAEAEYLRCPVLEMEEIDIRLRHQVRLILATQNEVMRPRGERRIGNVLGRPSTDEETDDIDEGNGEWRSG